MSNNIYRCPICSQNLTLSDKSYTCINRHCFDLSKYQYVNLLPNNQGGTHGDNREMVKARQEFLQTGLYRPLKNAIVNAVLKYGHTDGNYLDCGCGEGYYTEAVMSVMNGQSYAMDISKDSLRYASKRIPKARLSVASCYSLPYQDDSFSVATLIFSPLCQSEIHRVLVNDGLFVMVIPGKYHLFGLKKMLYDNPYENKISPYEIKSFDFIESIKIDYEIEIDNTNAQKLFKMTPYYYRTPKEGKDKLLSTPKLTTPISFEVLCYRAK